MPQRLKSTNGKLQSSRTEANGIKQDTTCEKRGDRLRRFPGGNNVGNPKKHRFLPAIEAKCHTLRKSVDGREAELSIFGEYGGLASEMQCTR